MLLASVPWAPAADQWEVSITYIDQSEAAVLPDNLGPGVRLPAADLLSDPENTVLKLLVKLLWRLFVFEPENRDDF